MSFPNCVKSLRLLCKSTSCCYRALNKFPFGKKTYTAISSTPKKAMLLETVHIMLTFLSTTNQRM